MPQHAAVWERVCETLEDMGLMTTADWAAVERYCSLTVRWRDGDTMLARIGATITFRTANPAIPHIAPMPAVDGQPQEYATAIIPHPLVKMLADLEVQLRQFETAFGLSPGARTRLLAALPGPALAGDDEAAGEPTVRTRARG